MTNLIYFLLGAAVIFISFKKSIILGLTALLAGFGIIAYILYPKIVIAKANEKFNNGDFDGAIKDYRKMIQKGRADIDLRITFASLLMRADKADVALEEINKILKYKFDIKKKYLAKQTRAMINYRLGNMADAREEIDEIFEDGYRTSSTYCIVGFFMLLMNDPIEETLKFCEEAYDYDEDNRDIADNMLVCYLKTKQYDKAKEVSDKLLKLAPEFVEGHYHSALLYEATGDFKKAKEYAEKIKDCKRTVMTTISEAEADKLVKRLS